MSEALWPIEEAKKLLPRVSSGKTILFETGYGPSGLPHIGTFGEVVRTIMVMRGLNHIAPGTKMRLICFSDDLDGLRKVPDNVPNRENLKNYLGYALTSIPDPFEKHESYGHYMNAKLREFLDLFGFEYEFKSATECYKSGIFDEKLLLVLKKYNQIMDVMLPTLGEERRETYSPFLPVRDGKVLQVKIAEVKDKTVIYQDNETGELIETEVTGGKCKLQWKPDWGMRWAALGVDFELHGKDLQPSAVLSAKICSILEAKVPELSMYELFLDPEGKKISKSKGNGLTIEEWLRYAPWESLAFFMFQNPRRAKRLYFDVIPRNVDDYLDNLQKFTKDDFNNPVSFIHNEVESYNDTCGITFSLLLNLASACNPESPEILWGFIKKYNENITKGSLLYRLTEHAINYYNDFVKPNKKYKQPSSEEKNAISLLADRLGENPDLNSPEELQQIVYSVGKDYDAKNIKNWFMLLYQVLLGQDQGPRIGSFISLYGVQNFIGMIRKL